jgi:deoxyribonuclease-2
MDENGNAIDWSYTYKLPKNSSSENDNIVNGVGYIYLTSDTYQEGWTLSNLAMDSTTEGLLANTVTQLYVYTDTENLAFINYNDEHPDGKTSSTKGHTKGVVVLDQDGGFWLSHSVPKFPPSISDGYSYPSSGTEYGQNLLCITVDVTQGDIIGSLLNYDDIYIFESAVGSEVESLVPTLASVVDGTAKPVAPWYVVSTLTSLNGISFTSFGKGKMYNADIYDNLVAPILDIDLYAETWQRGTASDVSPSNCSNGYRIQNVDSIIVNIADDQFSETVDHSKFAISQESSSPWVCIGDNNRMTSQWDRGGGALCLMDDTVWNAYSSLIETVEPCPSTLK